MTARRHSSEHPRIDPARFAALRAFFRGYLHQDLAVVHGSPAAAVAAFARDAGGAERDALITEWARFSQLVSDLPLHDVRRAFSALGAGWEPADANDLRELDRAFRI